MAALYFKKLEHNVERYSKTPVAGMVVLGSTGESILLSDQERRDVFKCAREHAAPEKVLVAGTGIESAVETLRLTEYAASLGYDVAMVRTPHYYKRQMLPANLLAFYRTVADRSPLPVIIYNFPQATGYDIPAEVVIELAEHPNLIGIKESAGVIDKVKKMVEGTRHIQRDGHRHRDLQRRDPAHAGRRRFRERFRCGSHRPRSAGLRWPRRPSLRPAPRKSDIRCWWVRRICSRIRSTWAPWARSWPSPAPHPPRATRSTPPGRKATRRWRARSSSASSRPRYKVGGELGIPGIKYAMDLNGYYGGPSRLPLLPLTAEQKAEVERLMAEIRN